MWSYPKLIAHRGGGLLAPENTRAALQASLRAGCRAVEFDVMLAADRVPVLMHDEHFGRTIAGTGSVATTSSTALTMMDAGGWFDSSFVGEPVPTYLDTLRFCSDNRIWMNVEIKPAHGFEAVTGSVVATLTRGLLGDDGAGMVLFSSFSPDALLAARDAAPGIARGLLVDTLPPDWQATLNAAQAVSLHIEHRALTRSSAGRIKAAGYGLLCYTVNSRQRARLLLDWGADAICTDRLDLFGTALRNEQSVANATADGFPKQR